MKFGVREITDIVFKASADNQRLGTATYDIYDPILFFDSAKTSTVEGAVATVYAQGGRGNPRLLAWDGDKTVTFTFEDALMTPYTFAALSGADLFGNDTANLHLTEKSNIAGEALVSVLSGAVTADGEDYNVVLTFAAQPSQTYKIGDSVIISGVTGNTAYNGTFELTAAGTSSIGFKVLAPGATAPVWSTAKIAELSAEFEVTVNISTLSTVEAPITIPSTYLNSTYIKLMKLTEDGDIDSLIDLTNAKFSYTGGVLKIGDIATAGLVAGDSVLVDFYVQTKAKQLEISAGKFAGYYYVEANTLFRGLDGKDYPAQFTIPKAKIQSNFTFTMAPTGDPSTFTFTLDAFPAPTRFDSTKKVLFTLDIFDKNSTSNI